MPQLKSKVEQWLRQIGCTPVVQADPKADWHLQVDWPPTRGLSLNVVGPKGQPDRIVIAGGTEISHEHHDAFDKLDDDGKEEFLWKFRHTVNVQEADFELVGAEGRLDCPSRFLISATRYEDGLTLDSFAQTLGAVFKTQLRAIWVVQQHLAPRSFGTGGRFDFKQLGL